MNRFAYVLTAFLAIAGSASGLLDSALIQKHLPFHLEKPFKKEISGKLVATGKNNEFFTVHTITRKFKDEGVPCEETNGHLRRYTEDGSLLWERKFGNKVESTPGERFKVYPQAVHATENAVYVLYHRSQNLAFDGCKHLKAVGADLYFEKRRRSDGKLLANYLYNDFEVFWNLYTRIQVIRIHTDISGDLIVAGTLSQFEDYYLDDIEDNPYAATVLRVDSDLVAEPGESVVKWRRDFGRKYNIFAVWEYGYSYTYASDLAQGECGDETCDYFLTGKFQADAGLPLYEALPYPAIAKFRGDTGETDPNFGQSGFLKLDDSGPDFELDPRALKIKMLNSGRLAVAVSVEGNPTATMELRVLSPSGSLVHIAATNEMSYPLSIELNDGISVLGVQGGAIDDYEWIRDPEAIRYGRWTGGLAPKMDVVSFPIEGSFDARTAGSVAKQSYRTLLTGDLMGKIEGTEDSSAQHSSGNNMIAKPDVLLSPHKILLRLTQDGDVK